MYWGFCLETSRIQILPYPNSQKKSGVSYGDSRDSAIRLIFSFREQFISVDLRHVNRLIIR